MTPGKFLRLIWPSTGLYCIAHPFKPEGSSITVYMHKVFATIGEAVTHVHEMEHTADTYFAMLSLREERIWDPDKADYKTGAKGAWAVRKKENMLTSKCSFFDLDVGTEAHKYPTQADAINDLLAFIAVTKLPMPVQVSSGGGIHVYWPYDADVPVDEWRPIALHMRQLAEHHGLKVDTTRTTDVTSVLRVPDTFNWKDRANPRRVEVIQEGLATPVATFKQLVSDAMIRGGVVPKQPTVSGVAPIAGAEGLAPQGFNDFGPKPKLSEVASACAQMQEILRSQGEPAHPFYGPLDNTAWYRGMLGVVKHVEDGDNWARKLTDLHPRTNADIDAKLLQLEQYPPARCETLQQFMPWKDSPCKGCRFLNDPSVPNPIAAARKATAAAPPVATPLVELVLVSPQVQQILLPNPPKPYERLKAGGIAVTRKDKDGNEQTSVIYRHDLFPLKRLVNSEESTEQQIWRVALPRAGMKDFVLDADVLYDAKKFCSAIANNGIYPNKADIPALQDYMVAYISQLQRDLDADTQTSHLGWSEDFTQFILPDRTLLSDGKVKASALTRGATTATQFVHKNGDLNEQIKLMRFYEDPAYIANQSVILDGFGSILFHMTGHNGIVVNCSGDAGASKTTTLKTMAGVWGDPDLWPINGTNRGATANARTQRVVSNANLPTPVDEITHIPPKEMMDLVMNISQPGHRIRLQTDGTERKVSSNYKSAIMVSTANSSLHAVLSTDNAGGTAGSMRVFEMRFQAQHVHTKAEADEFLRQVKIHYGHLGEIFARFVVTNLAAVTHRVQQVVRDVDAAAHIKSSERFWSARVAVGVVAAEICQVLNLLVYDHIAILRWSIDRQIPFMRGVVKEEYRDPLAVLTDYIAEKQGNILIINRSTSIGQNVSGPPTVGETAYAENKPYGALLGHHDVGAGVLYLLKQGFKDHCNRIGGSSSRILEDLNQPRARGSEAPTRIVIDRSVRRTLGGGTSLAKGQSWCFAVDMKHPEISGSVPLVTVSGGIPTSAPAGVLRAV